MLSLDFESEIKIKLFSLIVYIFSTLESAHLVHPNLYTHWYLLYISNPSFKPNGTHTHSFAHTAAYN